MSELMDQNAVPVKPIAPNDQTGTFAGAEPSSGILPVAQCSDTPDPESASDRERKNRTQRDFWFRWYRETWRAQGP